MRKRKLNKRKRNIQKISKGKKGQKQVRKEKNFKNLIKRIIEKIIGTGTRKESWDKEVQKIHRKHSSNAEKRQRKLKKKISYKINF